MTRMRLILLLYVLSLLTVSLEKVSYASTEVPPAHRIAVLLRALAYDKSLKSKDGEPVRVAILYKPGDAASQATRNEILEALDALGAVTIQGLPVSSAVLGYRGPDGLAQAIRSNGFDILYVCPGLDSSVSSIQQVTRSHKVRTITGQVNYVRNGLSIATMLKGNKPILLINLPAARSEGMNINSSLLRLATVLK